MNSRSGIFTFFLFLILSVMIVFQVLAMVQADRLYERVNTLVRNLENRPVNSGQRVQNDSSDSMDGDEGDWLVWRLNGEPSTLNRLHSSSDMYSRYIVSENIFESLLKYDLDEAVLEPFLAESYEISDDGLEITFILRDDIHFSDGVPITADDVVFTFNAIVDPDTDTTSLANYFQDIERVEKIRDHEVRFVFGRVYFRSLEIAGGMQVLPEHIYGYDDPQQFNSRISDPVGSGPYVFEKWDVGSEIVLRRNENYWNTKPNLLRKVYRIITNDTAALQALRAGTIDYFRPNSEQFHEMSNNEQFTRDFHCLSYWTPEAGYSYMAWNQDSPFFEDSRVRRAMTHIVDRQTMIEHLLKMPEAQIQTGPFYVHSLQTNPDIEPWPYDLDEARQLLDEAGWVDTTGDGIRDKDGVPFRFNFMIVSSGGSGEQIAKLLKDQAARVGIHVDVSPYEWSVFIQKLQDRDFDATMLSWGGGPLESDPYQIWHSSQIENRGSNFVGFNVPEADELIEQARKTLDRDERNKLYHRLHEIIHYEQPYTFLFTRPELGFLDGRFENVKIYELGLDEHEWYVPLANQKYKR